jgi:hypothetical protein
MEPSERRLRRLPGDEQHGALLDNAEKRHRLFALNEFKIRALKREAIKAGCGDDCMVLMLDLNDGLAREIHGMAFQAGLERRRVGQQPRPEDTLQLILLPYAPFRENFSPNHRAIFDGCSPTDIRVALFSDGRTMVMVMPGEIELADLIPIVQVREPSP